MGQVTIYLDEDTERKARDAARAEGVALSKWVARQLRRRPRGEWPEAVRALAGAWADAPSLETIRRYKAKDLARRRV
ncbi:MAG: CopG family transcriptional regulator [Betaproteobacteria bacterium RIFCSPLOWO2_02_67_12]|nr:MAG: CopG family transcriptional regulator [Betaproteobacteria bacterium RIFCSPLOWO2_02_67_12]OGA69241.1 MAG: CopG family transcriptional regulator [Betaproteobacteria bacterium RIFCSPLOWO2_12_FULL_67_28]